MMFGTRLASLAAGSRSGFIKCPQRIYSPLLSSSVLPSVVYRRHTSQLAGEADPADASASHLSPGSAWNFRQLERQLDGTINGKRLTNRLPYIWLRDNCRCSQCVNQDTMQRNFSIFDIPANIAPAEVKKETGGLRITWDYEHHESFYTWDFIGRHSTKGKRSEVDWSKRVLWGSEMAENPPTVNYHEVMDNSSESGMAKLTDHLMRYGLVFVDGTPFDDAIHTKRLLERIGPIRETHYGGFYDFVPDMAKADTAYSNIALPAHTDTTYFTDPAGLQAFHMLSHKPPPDAPEGASVSGGESLLVDGFNAAEILRNEDSGAFDTLKLTKIPWHASGNQGVTITSEEPQAVIEVRRSRLHDPPSNLLRIRWNNDDRGVNHLQRHSSMASRRRAGSRWYEAAAKWNEIIKRKRSEYWFQLKPGRTLIFDNYRVLHGRSAFTGMRRICGAYISRDDFISRWRNTNLSREEVLAQVIG